MSLISQASALLNRIRGGTSNPETVQGEELGWDSMSVGGAFGGTTAAGIRFNQEQAMTVSTVMACTRARSEMLASLPGMVYRELPNGARRRDSDSPLWSMLHDEPNPEMDSMTFFELMQTRIVNRGNGFAEIVRDRQDRPVELWPIHNSRVEPFRDSNNELLWRVYGDDCDGRSGANRYRTLTNRNMFNVVGHGGNGYLAKGVIPCASEEIALNMAMAHYGGSVFQSGAKPSGVVMHPKFYDDAKKRRIFRNDMNALHSGRENWHKMAVLWDGATWKEMQYSPEQSQLIEGRGYSAKELCRFYNTPPAIVQIFDDYKFDTADAMIQQFVMTAIRTDAIRVERAIKKQLIHTRDSRNRMVELFKDRYVFEFVINALLRGDAKKQAEVLEIERQNGVINANEWLALDNREPIGEQGEIYIVTSGFENLATLGKTYDKGASPPGGASGKGGSSDKGKASAQQLPKFDRARVIQALENGVPKHHDRSVGGSVLDATTVQEQLDESAVDVLTEAVERIESIASKEIARINGSLDESEQCKRLDAIWEKHATRLQSAVQPACRIYTKLRSELSTDDVSERVVQHLVADRELGKEVTIEMFSMEE